ncbi:Hypothetical protein ORPV_1177 [Orpheovirus IHUMI-LCC2]|uniref:Uncharacterized protein n=1 Tax=Orpheovirus IHUMI-LCC2 TaxID=2023057 RepID=A0A2I2L6E3_9VIRU|nr:Hypothetical protein ORPV_1177 [Orpheovirus IHUMI-LCC2]SNW63081.1 Hypothetical protein ORPV_1177 [Orpheovirus IHUMI-LCC2]
MKWILLIFAVITVSYCQNLCPYIELLENSCIYTTDCQAYTPYGYCRKFSGSYYGECASTLRSCPSGQDCYKESGLTWNCRVPSGGSCTSDSQCRPSDRCRSGQCKCPTDVNFGTDTCYWPADSLGTILGVTVCANTSRACYRIDTNPSNYYGRCSVPVAGTCDDDSDCLYAGAVCQQCKCVSRSNAGCKPYTPLMNILAQYDTCVRSFTVVASAVNADAWCDIAATNCKSLLADATYDSNNNLGNYLVAQIGSHSEDTDRMRFCNYPEYVTTYCGFNAFSTSMSL